MLTTSGDAFSLGAFGDGGAQGQSVLLPGGEIVAVWSQTVSASDPGPGGDTQETALVGGIYGPDGARRGDLFQVNQSAPGAQVESEITPLAGGGFVIAWSRYSATGEVARARIYDETGAPLGDAFNLATVPTGGTRMPQMAATPDGGFLAVWQDGRAGAYGQYFDVDGGRAGPEFRVLSDTPPRMDLTVLDDGKVRLLAGDALWTGDGSTFESGGAHVLDISSVSSRDTGLDPALSGAIRPLSDGRYIVAGLAATEAGGWRVEALVRDAGRFDLLERQPGADTDRFAVDTDEMTAQGAAVADVAVTALSAGRFIVTWAHVADAGGTLGAEIRARIFAPDLTPLSEVVTVQPDPGAASLRVDPFVTELADGRIFVGWTDDGEVISDVPADTVGRFLTLGASGQPTTGDDQLTGTEDPDDAVLLAGDDLYTALGGADSVLGGPGADTIRGGDGPDQLFGNLGADVVEGGRGFDTLRGDAGADVLRGGGGGDDMSGGDGDDTLFGNDGFDLLRNGGGDDLFFGGVGQDTLLADDGGVGGDLTIDLGDGIWERVLGGQVIEQDTAYDIEAVIIRDSTARVTLAGDGLDNLLVTDAGADRVIGQDGDDTLTTGAGNDTADGGTGFDRITLGDGADIGLGFGGWDTIEGGAGNDLLSGHRGEDNLDGGAGRDTLYGGNHDDQLTGGAGRDALYGGAGNDALFDLGGGESESADTLFGGAGADTLSGGDGADDLRGHSGDDQLSGGSGQDSLFGGDQRDALYGDAGDDLVFGGRGMDSAFLGDGADTWWDDPQTLFGDDRVSGGRGPDTLHSAGGDDTLRGDGGADTFHFVQGIGAMEISDFQPGLDALVFEAALWGGPLTQARLDALAETGGGTLVLDFGGGASLTLAGIVGTEGLLSDIILG